MEQLRKLTVDTHCGRLHVARGVVDERRRCTCSGAVFSRENNFEGTSNLQGASESPAFMAFFASESPSLPLTGRLALPLSP